MNSIFRNQINFALVIVISLLLVLGCDASISLNGKVQDESGNIINEAKIIVEQGKSKIAEEKSKNDGSFHIFGSLNTFPFAGKIKLIISKEGYEIYEKELSQEQLRSNETNVILKKN